MTFSRNSDSLEAARERLWRRIQVEGAEVAFDALVDVVRNPASTAQARATAGAALMRAAGMFEAGKHVASKEPHEMTPEELDRAIRRLNGDRGLGNPEAPDDDIFA